MLFSAQSPFCVSVVSRFPQHPAGLTAPLLNSLDLLWQSRALLSSLFLSALFNTMAPTTKKTVPHYTPKKGDEWRTEAGHRRHLNSIQIWGTVESWRWPNHSEGRQSDHGALTTTLAATNTRVDSLTTLGVHRTSTPTGQPDHSRPSAGEKPWPCYHLNCRAWSDLHWGTSLDPGCTMHESILSISPEHHWWRVDSEEDEQPQPRRRTKITSGKLRTMDTTTVK